MVLSSLFYRKLFTILFFCVFCVKANAKDYGRYGNTFNIEEQDLLEYIQVKLQEIDMEKWQNDFRRQAIKSINRPKPTKLPYAKENKVYYYDPSIILQRDYVNDSGVVFAKKGTKLNPLDSVFLSNWLLFIDGDNDKQVDWAIGQYNKNNGRVKIILLNGAIVDLMNKNNIRFYFDQKGLLVKKFNIQNIPALVHQENKLLRVEEVVLDYE